MSVEFRAGDPDDARRQIEPFERELRGAGCGDGWRNDGRQGRHAADAAAVGANCIPCPVGRGGRLIGHNAMTNSAVGLRDRIGSRAGSAKIRNQARERNRVSRNERDNALPQWPLGDCHAHDPVSPPLDR